VTQFVLVYDSTLGHLKRSIVDLSTLSTGGAGGGSSGGTWRAGASNPEPAESVEFNQDILLFTPGAGQYLYRVIKVPPGYTAGQAINMYIDAYTPSTSGTFLLQTTANLIRKNTDAAGSTTNQRVSTNTALTAVATANRLFEINCDITDGTGNINGVAVSAGDEIEIWLARPSGTDTADTRFRPDSTTFTY
jgi:hypothetical protein